MVYVLVAFHPRQVKKDSLENPQDRVCLVLEVQGVLECAVSSAKQRVY